MRDKVGCGGTDSGVAYVWTAVGVGIVVGVVPYVGVGTSLFVGVGPYVEVGMLLRRDGGALGGAVG